MCLSSVYKREAGDNALLLSNVQRIAFDGDELVFTDLFENETRIRGRLISADLIGGKIIVDTE